MDLPLDILFIIARNFRGDRHTLSALALVSKQFLVVARTFLFNRVKVASLNPRFNKHVARMTYLLSYNPELLQSTRILELGPAVLRMPGRDPVSAFHTQHWAAVHSQRRPSIHDPRVEFIMANVPNVRSLTLRFEFQDWNNFSPSFQDSIARIVTQESLTTLRIEDVINFPLHLLSKSRSIEHLYLGFVAQHPEEHTQQTIPTTYPTPPLKRPTPFSPSRLLSLTLFESDDCVASLIRHLDLSHLRRLSVNATGFDGRAALREIPKVAHQIRTLELRLCNQKLATLPLPVFPNVKTLILNLPFPFRTTFEDIHTLILSSSTPPPQTPVPSLPNLSDLKVFFRKLRDGEMWAYMLDPMLDPGWDLLDPEYTPHPSLQKTTWVVSERQVGILQQADDHIIDLLLDSRWSEKRGRVIEVAEDRFEAYSPVHF